jgi:hypothetical protein
MNKHEAREILLLYRPGAGDEGDPEIVEAMRLAQSDPELAQWFKAQCETTGALRAKLRAVQVPDGLKEQILSERAVRGPIRISRRAAVPALAAVFLLLLTSISFFYFRSHSDNPLASFRDRMVRIAVREYPRMDLETADLNRIRQFLGSQQAHGDYILPHALENATGTGCAILRPWRGQPVSMICFSSGTQTDPSKKSDLFLFVIDRGAVPNAPSAASPKFARMNAVSTLTWSSGNKTYLLVGEGDRKFLKKFY